MPGCYDKGVSDGIPQRLRWNCGGTDCPAPTGNYYIDRKAEAIRAIKRQPFFKLRNVPARAVAKSFYFKE
jgi:hypothetical protein